MQKLTKDGRIETDNWQRLESREPLEEMDIRDGQWLISLPSFLADAERYAGRANIGLWLVPDDDIDSLAKYAGQIAVIAVEFPTFTDGRGFSQARILRDQLDFEGELRAVGAFIQDQLFYLKRCGFDAFIIDDDIEPDELHTSLNDFSDSYQAATDEPRPIFRRRA